MIFNPSKPLSEIWMKAASKKPCSPWTLLLHLTENYSMLWQNVRRSLGLLQIKHLYSIDKEFQRTQELLRLEEERSRLLGQKIASIAAKVLDEMSSIEASLEEDQRLLHKLQKRLQSISNPPITVFYIITVQRFGMFKRAIDNWLRQNVGINKRPSD